MAHVLVGLGMKRSEMVAEMALRFKDIYGYGLEESKALAEDLLSLCEYKGMLPPLQENIDMYTEPYQWEPEDDKRD